MNLIDSLLQSPRVYRLWQTPFAERKFAPLYLNNDLSTVCRVLDVGCGPGTNTAHFAHAEYLGIDLNPRYVKEARERFGRNFAVEDATQLTIPIDTRFDCILVNSLLHHLNTDDVRRLLDNLAGLLSGDGHVHILDLIKPGDVSVSNLLARLDRGGFPRPLREWRSLFEEAFEPVVFEPYTLGVGRVPLWRMIYFKGKGPGK